MKNKMTKPSKAGGFTFVETLVSITILMFVISGVLTMTTVHMKTNFNQINHTKAIKLAEAAIERKMREDFDSLAGESYGYGAIENYPVYSRIVTITNIDTDNKRIDVTVTWEERSRAGLAPVTLSLLRTR